MPPRPSMDETEASRDAPLMNRLFSSCAEDPKGSVHRAWGISLIFLVFYFVISVIESELLDNTSSLPSVWYVFASRRSP